MTFTRAAIIQGPDNRRMPLLPVLAGALFALAALPLFGQALPPEVDAALAKARIPRDAVTMVVAQAGGELPARLSYRADVPVNPASIAKLATTFAALDLLGPAFSWSTPVYLEGSVRDGTLQGNLYIQGLGDPKLVTERLWLLLRRVQGLGIRTIAGDIVLDHSAFETMTLDPGAFDGEPLRPYNTSADALLVNFKSVIMTFTPQGNAVLLHLEPPLAGVQWPASVPVSTGSCSDWRGALKADFSDPSRPRFDGAYPSACGEQSWPLAFGDPSSYAGRAIAGMWQQMGGALTGKVRDGKVPPGLPAAFESRSPPLAEIVRDVNKFSNNVMAQQLFLTLSLQQQGLGTLEGSREVMRQWWRSRVGGADMPSFGNGSGLSRDEHMTARQLTRLLQVAWASAWMPELASSLPLTGVDGTLRRMRGKSVGQAHLKTGSLRDVTGVAGYVEGASGKRYVLVAIANHRQAAAARPAIEALIEWAARDQ